MEQGLHTITEIGR